MSNKIDSITFMEHIVNAVKNFQKEEMELKDQLEGLLEGVIQRFITILSQLEEVHPAPHRTDRPPRKTSR